MNFSLLKVDKPLKLKSLSKAKVNFFKREEEISIFHFNKFDSDLFHVVFNINDEYQIGTKKLGNQHNLVYSSLINFFFLLNSNYAFLEYLNKEYQEEILNEVQTRTKASVGVLTLDNELLMKIYRSLDGTIKKLQYTSPDEEYFNLEYVNDEQLNKIFNENTIDSYTVLIEGQFISISKEGRISVDNSDEDFVINFTKRLLNAIS